TVEIAKAYNGSKVYDYKWTNDFSAARNFALSKSNADWNLILDSDEQITSWNKDKVNRLLQTENIVGKISIK
ncbi:glycosyltransferase, partial [Escherichia coli]|uniref:glycosyltransferase n=1 Tax=Escherichia coli TaxID=562 RepID=UPI000E2FAABE